MKLYERQPNFGIPRRKRILRSCRRRPHRANSVSPDGPGRLRLEARLFGSFAALMAAGDRVFPQVHKLAEETVIALARGAGLIQPAFRGFFQADGGV